MFGLLAPDNLHLATACVKHGWTSPITIPAPILTSDPALLIGVGLNQARINDKAFATHQTDRYARLHDPLEHTTEKVSLAEALVACARERRMIRDRVLDAEPAEPAIGKVHLHFTADQPLRADRKDIRR
jgi:hypothetical protein